MDIVKKHTTYQIVLGVFAFIIGLLFIIFSRFDFMGTFLGYLFASLLLIFSLAMCVLTFFKESEHFPRIFFYVFLIAISIWFFLDPIRIVVSIPIILGTFIIGSVIALVIKFIILKRASLRSMFVVTELIIAVIMIVVGVLLCVFYQKIDVVITCILLGIPLMIFGVGLVSVSILRMIRNR